MPSFILKVLEMPAANLKTAEDIRVKLKPLYDKKSPYHVMDDISYVRADKNVHATLLFNTRLNSRRQKSLNRFKYSVCMEDYRRYFRSD